MVRTHDEVGIVSAVQWAIAKGHLNAVVGALGQMYGAGDKFKLMQEAVDNFVKQVEENELHIP